MAKRKKNRLKKRYGHAMPLEVLEKRTRHMLRLVKARGGRV